MFDWLRRVLFGQFYKADDCVSQAAELYKRYNEILPLSHQTWTIPSNAIAKHSLKSGDRYAIILINLALALTELGNRTTGGTDSCYNEPISTRQRNLWKQRIALRPILLSSVLAGSTLIGRGRGKTTQIFWPQLKHANTSNHKRRPIRILYVSR